MRQDIPANSNLRPVSRNALFLGFLKIGMLGFGGVAPWARHIIIEERGWLNDQEYAEILGVSQILPGPNTMNLAILIGNRFQGAAGALLSVVGQLAIPLVVVTLLSVVYDRFAALADVNAALIGAAAGAAGLVVGTGLKMARNIRPAPLPLLIAAAAFVAVGLLQWPLIPVVIGLGLFSVAVAKPEQPS